MQHQYIQNLQKANLFLKAKVKELQVKKEDEPSLNKIDNSLTEKKKDNKENVYGAGGNDEFELIPVGKIEQINKKEMIQHRMDLNEEQPQKKFYDRPPYENKFSNNNDR